MPLVATIIPDIQFIEVQLMVENPNLKNPSGTSSRPAGLQRGEKRKKITKEYVKSFKWCLCLGSPFLTNSWFQIFPEGPGQE